MFPPETEYGDPEWRKYVAKTVATVNYHAHADTCWKNGQKFCRFRFPMPPCQETGLYTFERSGAGLCSVKRYCDPLWNGGEGPLWNLGDRAVAVQLQNDDPSWTKPRGIECHRRGIGRPIQPTPYQRTPLQHLRSTVPNT
jgi:hypothetical protein